MNLIVVSSISNWGVNALNPVFAVALVLIILVLLDLKFPIFGGVPIIAQLWLRLFSVQKYIELIDVEEEIPIPQNAVLLFDSKYNKMKKHGPSGGVLVERGDTIYLNDIVLYKGAWNRYDKHPDGIVVVLGDKLMINQRVCYEGPFEGFIHHPQGLLIEVTYGVLNINDRVVFEGGYDDYFSHPQGIILKINESLYLIRC